jgi:hypothetical protein
MWIDGVAVEMDDTDASRETVAWCARPFAPRSEIVLVHERPDPPRSPPEGSGGAPDVPHDRRDPPVLTR